MLLILAKERDSLANAVCRVARHAGTDVLMCAKPELSNTQTAGLERLLCGGAALAASDLTGVLFRLSACWWRSGTADGDQDLIAAWYTLLWDLPCPVINRFALSWWFDPAGYGLQLSLHLNAEVRTSRGPRGDIGAATVYIAGSQLIAADPESAAAADRLFEQSRAIRQWQRETGVYLARLSYRGGLATPVSIEPCPDFASESAEIRERVAEALYSSLTRREV